MNNAFTSIDGELHCERVALRAIADKIGTPYYVYSRAAIEAQWRAFNDAFGARRHLVCYAVKANSNLSVLNLLARLGAGFDIVSGGELECVLRAGGSAERIVFSGVGKTRAEMRRALDVGVRCFNVESVGELERLQEESKSSRRRAAVALRVNPDVDAGTHPYISTGLKQNKFGIPIEDAHAIYHHARDLSHIDIVGIDCHIGSQLTSVAPFVDALARVLKLVDTLRADGIALRHLDVGGGLGIRYRDETPPTPAEYVAALLAHLSNGRYDDLEISLEPGRAIVGNAGALVTRLEYVKHGTEKNFAIVDAGMNDLLRPALYDAYHAIVPVKSSGEPGYAYDIVGPVCESGDFLGRDRRIAAMPGDLLAVLSAGAYGAAMSSNYNTRPRAAEVLVDGTDFHVVRRRETLDDLLAPETLFPG